MGSNLADSNSEQSYFRNRNLNFLNKSTYWSSRWRAGLIRLLERILIGVNISDRLAGDSTNLVHLSSVASQILEISLFENATPSKTVFINNSNSLFPNLPLISNNRSTLKILIKNANVDLESGLIRLDNGTILEEALPQWQQLINAGGLVDSYRNLGKSLPSLEGRFTFLPVSNYYYHTLIENLPAILKLHKTNPELKILVKEGAPGWVYEMLDYFSMPFICCEHRFVKISELEVLTSSRGIASTDVDVLRAKLAASNRNTKTRLILTRGNLPRGNPAQEKELYSLLNGFGFTEFDAAGFTFSQQVAIFSNAEFIVGFAGAALANIVWASPNTKVFEIFNHPYRINVYASLASAANLDYASSEWQESQVIPATDILDFFELGN